MIVIDGSISNGSQILRDALALSLVTGKSFNLNNLQPLSNNHLGYIKAAATISGANVEGANLGSREITFTPNTIHTGLLSISTMASINTPLLIQTILPALARAPGSSILQLRGGTHFPSSPTVDFLTTVYLPLVNCMGTSCSIRCPDRGFYPAGGGKVQLDVHPAKHITPLTLVERGEMLSKHATVINANLPGHIAERELAMVRLALGWASKETNITFDSSPEPGNILHLELAYKNFTMLISCVGQRGVRAEAVADNAISAVRNYLSHTAPADEHLAHQLIVPMMALGGGQLLTNSISSNCKNLIAMCQSFAPGNVKTSTQGLNTLISIQPY